MTEMAEVVDFIRRYAQAEYEERVASYTEKKYARYLEKQETVMEFLEPSVTSGFSRSAFESDAYFGQFAAKAEKLGTRVLFKVEEHEHPKYGMLFRAFLGGDKKGDESYSRAIFVARPAGDWKIVAIYALDRDEEEELEWERYRGAKIQHLAQPVAVEKLKPPADALHLQDYEGS